MKRIACSETRTIALASLFSAALVGVCRSKDALFPRVHSSDFIGLSRGTGSVGGGSDGPGEQCLRLGSLFRTESGIKEGDALRLRPVVFYSLSHHRVQHLFWKYIDCTCVVRRLCTPCGFVFCSGLLVCAACARVVADAVH
jgi:hypothetical protein